MYVLECQKFSFSNITSFMSISKFWFISYIPLRILCNAFVHIKPCNLKSHSPSQKKAYAYSLLYSTTYVWPMQHSHPPPLDINHPLLGSTHHCMFHMTHLALSRNSQQPLYHPIFLFSCV